MLKELDSYDWEEVFGEGGGWNCTTITPNRWFVARGGCDYSGWGCQASNSGDVASSQDDIIRFGMSDGERERFGPAEIRAAIEAAVPCGRTDNGCAEDIGAWKAGVPSEIQQRWDEEFGTAYWQLVAKHPGMESKNLSRHLGTLGFRYLGSSLSVVKI